ncbi:MAG: pyridoxal-phosphate dependent enzyme [Planctomycetes bacterium]|nr:pyridoxal-phosphate dependent enzyme [Planctomycetota bacterium]
MKKVYDSILDTIGNTPMVKLSRIGAGLPGVIYAKLEAFNPGQSAKDRIGLYMIRDAEANGRIKPGGTIIESTSGNTGVGLAITCILLGYKLICTTNDKQSSEKINLLKAFGAEVIVCPTAVEPDDPRSYYSVARKLESEIPNSVWVNQYDNQSNPLAHYETTGPEIWDQTDGKVAYFVAGMGTGGTATGVGRFLKEKNPTVKIVAADPKGSLFHEYHHKKSIGRAHPYLVEGVGEDIIPKAIDWDILDDVLQFDDKMCFLAARRLARTDGVFIGGSGGLALCAALEVARKAKPGEIVVVLFPETGSRSLSKLYNDEWMRENQMLPSRGQFQVEDIVENKARPYRSLISIAPSQKVSEGIALMKEYDLSVVPVIDDGNVVGSLSESEVIDFFMTAKDPHAALIEEVMSEAPPVLSARDSFDQVNRLLIEQREPAVLVRNLDGSLDIITKADLITLLSSS